MVKYLMRVIFQRTMGKFLIQVLRVKVVYSFKGMMLQSLCHFYFMSVKIENILDKMILRTKTYGEYELMWCKLMWLKVHLLLNETDYHRHWKGEGELEFVSMVLSLALKVWNR